MVLKSSFEGQTNSVQPSLSGSTGLFLGSRVIAALFLSGLSLRRFLHLRDLVSNSRYYSPFRPPSGKEVGGPGVLTATTQRDRGESESQRINPNIPDVPHTFPHCSDYTRVLRMTACYLGSLVQESPGGKLLNLPGSDLWRSGPGQEGQLPRMR